MALAAILAGAQAVAAAAPAVLSGLQSLSQGIGSVGQIGLQEIGSSLGGGAQNLQNTINAFMAQQQAAQASQDAAAAAATGAQQQAAQNAAGAAALGGASPGFFDTLSQKLGVSPTWVKVGVFGGGGLLLAGGIWFAFFRKRAK